MKVGAHADELEEVNLLTEDNKIITGCNVENAAYPQSQKRKNVPKQLQCQFVLKDHGKEVQWKQKK